MKVMNHLFFGDEVRGFADKLHERRDVARPFVEDLGRVLLLAEVHYSFEAVDFRLHCLVDHQVRQKLLGFLVKINIKKNKTDFR